MKRTKIRVLTLVAVLCLTACKDDAIRKAARASDDMATTVSLAIDTKRQLAQANLITQGEEIQLSLGLQKVNAAVKAFHAEVMRLSKVNPQSKGQLLALLGDITKSLNDLTSQGVLGIKNPDSKAKIQAILAGFTTAFATINAALGT